MPQPKKPFEITGRHVLFMVIAFFAVIFTVNFIFVKLAVQSFPGEEDEKSYYQGLTYNDTLAEKARQAETGWRMLLLETPAEDDAEVIRVKLLDAEGQPIYDANLSGELSRPTTDDGLRLLEFTPLADGIYRVDVQDLPRGAWDLTLEAREEPEGEVQFSASTRLVKP